MSENAPAEIGHKQILYMTKQLLRMSDTTDHDAFLFTLIDWAASSLNTTERVIGKSCNVDVEDNRFKMPSDAKELYAFRGVGNCYNGIFVDTNFISTCGCQVTGYTGGFLNVVTKRGRWFYFTNPIADGSEYELAYSAVNRDCDGLMVINEEAEQACSFYAAFMFANSFQNTMNYTKNQIDIWSSLWSRQSGRCRGNAAVRTKNQQRNQISSRMNSIIDLSQVAWGSLGSILPVFWYTNNPANPYGI